MKLMLIIQKQMLQMMIIQKQMMMMLIIQKQQIQQQLRGGGMLVELLGRIV
jgi:hypothetical protein